MLRSEITPQVQLLSFRGKDKLRQRQLGFNNISFCAIIIDKFTYFLVYILSEYIHSSHGTIQNTVIPHSKPYEVNHLQ